MLTENGIRKLEPRAKPYRVADYGSMFIVVQPNGARLWRFKYRLDGRQSSISLGSHPEVSLANARKERDRMRAQVRAKIDPVASRQAERLKRQSQRKAGEFRLSLSKTGELSITTIYQSIRLTAQHTEALRSFLLAEAEARGTRHATD